MDNLDQTLGAYAHVIRQQPNRNEVLITCNWIAGLYRNDGMALMNALAKLPEDDKKVIQRVIDQVK